MKARAAKAQATVQALCDGEIRWTMRVPAREESDPDLIISDSLKDVGPLVEEVERLTALLKRKEKYADKWGDKPESYWLGALIEEVGELGASLNGEHEHTPDLELSEIATIALNWLERRASKRKTT